MLELYENYDCPGLICMDYRGFELKTLLVKGSVALDLVIVEAEELRGLLD